MPRSIFEVVKENVTAYQVAERYGLKVNSNGMTCCPFHEDGTPSMKVDRRYYCFGCGATGDATDLAARLLAMQPREAAVWVARNFGVITDEDPVNGNPEKITAREKTPVQTQIPGKARGDPIKEKTDWSKDTVKLLLDCKWKLVKLQRKYAPQVMDEEWHPLFCEALNKSARIDYLLDELMSCSAEHFATIEEKMRKEVNDLDGKLGQLLERERRCDQGHSVADDNER